MTANSFEQARFNMVEQQVRPWEVLDSKVLNMVGEMPRDIFVPEQYQGLAYADIEIPLGEGQTMMFPKMEGKLLQALNIQEDDKILEVGTGSGYLTACLAKLGGHVISQEINEHFLGAAKTKLDNLGITNVELQTADSLSENTDNGQFDVIAITGSLPEAPEAFKQKLNVGGRLFLIVGEGSVMEACLITRVNENSWRTEALFETETPALINAPVTEKFQF